MRPLPSTKMRQEYMGGRPALAVHRMIRSASEHWIGRHEQGVGALSRDGRVGPADRGCAVAASCGWRAAEAI
jgi:hypothetical protein